MLIDFDIWGPFKCNLLSVSILQELSLQIRAWRSVSHPGRCNLFYFIFLAFVFHVKELKRHACKVVDQDQQGSFLQWSGPMTRSCLTPWESSPPSFNFQLVIPSWMWSLHSLDIIVTSLYRVITVPGTSLEAWKYLFPLVWAGVDASSSYHVLWNILFSFVYHDITVVAWVESLRKRRE